jgi:hypothetical protein
MNSMFRHVVLAGAATLALAACASQEAKNAALSPSTIAANSQLHHAPRLPKPGVWQLIVDPAGDLHSND